MTWRRVLRLLPGAALLLAVDLAVVTIGVQGIGLGLAYAYCWPRIPLLASVVVALGIRTVGWRWWGVPGRSRGDGA